MSITSCSSSEMGMSSAAAEGAIIALLHCTRAGRYDAMIHRLQPLHTALGASGVASGGEVRGDTTLNVFSSFVDTPITRHFCILHLFLRNASSFFVIKDTCTHAKLAWMLDKCAPAV